MILHITESEKNIIKKIFSDTSAKIIFFWF